MIPDIQLHLRPGIIEFGWGHPAATLLPVDGMARAAARTLERDGYQALTYGAEQGPGCLITQFTARLAQLEGNAPSPEQVFITGGISQALDLICTLFARPGDIALVDSPTYHLALRILRDHDLELLPVAADEQGICIDALEALLASLQAQGRTARLLYCVPTFGNPTGISLDTGRRAALVELAARHGLLLIEDDVYRELWYDAPPPPPLASYAALGPVIRLGSFSKLLAPGLRLGWLIADPEIVQRCVQSGLLDSGGGINHFTAHIVATFIELGLLDAHVALLRESYRQRRDTLLAALSHWLPPSCHWKVPSGGFFVWLRLPTGVDSAALLPHAEAAGVSYLPGTRFYTGGGGAQYLRLSFSLLHPEAMEEGARRLGALLRH